MRWGVLLVAAVLVLTGCSSETTSGEPQRTSAPTDGFDLLVPIEFARALDSPAEGTRPLPDPDGVPLHVEDPFLTVTELEVARVSQPEGSTTFGLDITLSEEDGQVFSRWTEDHTGERAAVLVDGEIVFAPLVQAPIPDREITISGQYDRSDAENLLYKLTGR